MKTLYIVRHAKSSWEYDGIKDIDRPLKKRGINDAYLISSDHDLLLARGADLLHLSVDIGLAVYIFQTGL